MTEQHPRGDKKAAPRADKRVTHSGRSGEGFHAFAETALARAEQEMEVRDPNTLRLSLMLRKISQMMSDESNQTIYQPEGWTQTSFRVCFGLWISGPMPQHQISSDTNMSRATVSAALKNLEQTGFIDRKQSDADQRSSIISLTDKGTEAIIHSYRQHIELELDWFAPLTDIERLLLLSLLGKILQGPAANPSP